MRRRLSNDEEKQLAARLDISLNNANHFEAGVLAALTLLVNEVAALKQEIGAVAAAAERLARFK